MADHLGINDTYLRLRERYFWINMRKDCEQWVNSCRVCAARKRLSAKSFGDLQTVFVHYIGQTWAMDIVGPLPVTENGKRFILVAVEYLSWLAKCNGGAGRSAMISPSQTVRYAKETVMDGQVASTRGHKPTI
jgi:hypothetical protein